MKQILYALSLLTSLQLCAQSSKSEETKIQKTIELFFESFKEQDTLKYKQSVFLGGQVWSINYENEPATYNMRQFSDDMDMFDAQQTYEEIGSSFDIKVREGLATAYVPYTFKLNGTFSHCGVDVFTLIKDEEDAEWKIINLSYTIEKTGCEAIKK